jgi:S-formylglutathione hydrolase FrmB
VKLKRHKSNEFAIRYGSDAYFYTLAEDESKLRGVAGFGEAMLKENGIPAIHFINLQNHWWQIPDLASAIDIANKWLASSTSRVGYGASMGGYAALNFSERLRLDKVLSFSPQYSIDKKKVPWETRWQNEADKLTFTDDDLVVAENCTTHIIYDPNIRDGKHVDLISLTGKTILHRVEGAGHKAIEAFSKADLLKPLVLSVLQGDLDVSIIQRLKNTGKETLRGHMMINIEERGATRGTADIGPVLQRCIDEAAEVVAMRKPPTCTA